MTRTEQVRRGFDATRLIQRMGGLGCSKQMLAKAVGCPTERVEDWCKGEWPTQRELMRAASFLGCTVGHLIGVEPKDDIDMRRGFPW